VTLDLCYDAYTYGPLNANVTVQFNNYDQLISQPSTWVYPNPSFVLGEPGCVTFTYTLMNSDCITPYSGIKLSTNPAGISAVSNMNDGYTETACIQARDSSILNKIYSLPLTVTQTQCAPVFSYQNLELMELLVGLDASVSSQT
jgi:hypothetical protein